MSARQKLLATPLIVEESDDERLFGLLEKRVGLVHLRQRLGIESDREALIFGQGRTFFHPQNWHSLRLIIRTAFYLSGMHERGRRNALSIEIRYNDFVVPKLPAQFDGFKMLHISDLHVDMNEAFPAILAEKVRDLEYDLCLLTGDFRYRTYGTFEPALAGMETVSRELRGPVYAVLGNHDSIRMVPGLEQMGIRMLMNESVTIQRDGAKIYLSGIDDPHYYRAENFERAYEGVSHDGVSMLLAHSPEVFRRAAYVGFDMMLCGHTHGGQLCLPGRIPITVDADCPRKYCVGKWQYKQLQGYTSVGAGSSIVDLRLNNRPEVTLHRLVRSENS